MAIRIQQAIFTSQRGPQVEGYQLTSKSEGITEDLARELSHWGPSHDALQESDEDASSLNFHPLRNGNYCISRSVFAGAEYSGRAGMRVYTQMLVVPAEGLAMFDNNPFLVWKAAVAGGRIVVLDNPPETLSSFPLIGHPSGMDEGALADTLSVLEMDAVAELTAALVERPHVAIITDIPAEQLVAVLLHLLPSEQRTLVSFSTGLRCSPRRPFRLTIAPKDPMQQQALTRLSGLHLVELATCENAT